MTLVLPFAHIAALAAQPSSPPLSAMNTCFAQREEMNLPDPLAADRCSVRYASLSSAKAACTHVGPTCTGVVDDGGLPCHGADMQFELRKSTHLVALTGTTSWVRAVCPSPPPPSPTPAPPPPSPLSPYPAPSPPFEWACFVEHEDANLDDPLKPTNRCAARYGSLSAAKLACLDRSPECTGIVDDNGLICDGHNFQFELRRGVALSYSFGNTAWVRTACPSPPSAPPPPPSPPRPPSPPTQWSCFEEHEDGNLADPLNGNEDRCSVRYSRLSAAKTACLRAAPRCTGVVDDGGLTCGGHDLQFELRTDNLITQWKGMTAWARVACPPSPPPPSPPPPPPPPPASPRPPSPPEHWTCFEEHAESNVPELLSDDRCSVRYSSLAAAQAACLARSPECTGIVDDGGLECLSAVVERPFTDRYPNIASLDSYLPGGGRALFLFDGPYPDTYLPTGHAPHKLQFELRRDSRIVASPGNTAWARTLCAPPPPSVPPPSTPDYAAAMVVVTLSTMGGASLAVFAVCLLYAWSSYRRLNPTLLGGREEDAEAGMEMSDEGAGTTHKEGAKGASEADTAHLLSADSINYYLKEPGVGLYETVKAVTG